jgi:hypothetical protein
MRSGLIALSQADPAAVKQYLLDRQIEREIIDWKYFDPCFNRQRERGVVWIRENQVAGFLGLIPFRLEKGEVRADCAWSCDWSVDPGQGAGMGLLLVKRARELYDGIFNVGGNENTRRIFPRLADRTVLDAGISLVLPLRLGSVFARLPRGRIQSLLSQQELLQRIPLRWVRGFEKTAITMEPGLAPRLISLIESAPRGEWRPAYDAEFFDWQFRRCPAITCCSCWISSESPLRTAAIIWRARTSGKFWRFVLCGETHDSDKLKMLIAAIVSFVYSQGCVALFSLASHRESDLIKQLRRRGFLPYGKLPFYGMRGRCAELPTDDFCVLNFLDADLAYRFEHDKASPEL